MSVKFNKLKVENRFSNTFENWTNNNILKFGNKNFISIYASNGVGKSSFAKALKNEIKATYEYEYKGRTYTEKDKDNSFLIIDDFFCRNIAVRENEKLSDYILGTEIKKELELKQKLIDSRECIRNQIIEYLKNVYSIKGKDSKITKLLKDDDLIKFVNAVANIRNKGKKEYNENEFIDFLSTFVVKEKITIDTNKHVYVKEDLAKEDSIIELLMNFDVSTIRTIDGFGKLDIDNDALEILKKHKDIKKCIFDESHLITSEIKNKLEENKQMIINQLTEQQKKLVDKILNLNDETPFKFKEIFTIAFETGNLENIEKLIEEIELILLYIESSIKNQIIKIISDNKLKSIYEEYKTLIEKKVELNEEDEILISELIKNCVNKEVKLSRDENKNIIFTINDTEIIGKTRQELPLSTGEQNFISLYFELLSAKNSTKEIIIIDDPISSFDSIYKNKIIFAILKVLSKKRTIILTHNVSTIKLMQHQYRNCFNLYLLNNQPTGNNGFVKIERRNNNNDTPKDLDLLLEIKNVVKLFKSVEFISDIKDKHQFLISVIPFIRSYINLFGNNEIDYKKLCKLMHGYENDKVIINQIYKIYFGTDIVSSDYEINVQDILNTEVVDEIVDKSKYPLLNRTLIHILKYLKLRLLVEETLYKTDITKLDVNAQYQLQEIIEIYLNNNIEYKSIFLSKKTLLNEFNHFEFDMCLFMPSLDISDYKLAEEETSIIEICNKIKNNGLTT